MSEAWKGRRAAAEPLEAAREQGYGLPDDGLPHGGHSHGHGHGPGDDSGGGGGDDEPGVTRTVRTAVHRGREIRIETTYKVTIDGEPLPGTLEVLEDGRVHHHGLPQYALPSAVAMVERVIDYFGSKPDVDDELGALIEECDR